MIGKDTPLHQLKTIRSVYLIVTR